MRERKIEKYLIKSPKQMIMVIALFTLIIFVGGTTYAFFNYTRTGGANTVRVGRIYFNHTQDGKINLTNAFPINVTKDENGHITNETGFDTVEINIEGDTDYVDGVEYLVSSTNTNITTSNGTLVPISLDITATNLGTENTNYFTARESKDTTMYKKIVGGTLVGDQMLLVGYIKPNTTSGTVEGIQNGKLTIKAYLDDSNILVSDTYDGTESDNMGTPNSLAQGKTVLTTTEWNSLSSSGISFQIKVEANEGIWVKDTLDNIIRTKNINTTTNRPIMDNEQSKFVTASTGIDFGAVSSDTNGKGIYMRAGTENDAYPIVYYRGAVEDNNVLFNNKCWKAVRTTDTGGVKLIYNGELSDVYGSGDAITRATYTNVSTPVNPFAFDTTDNSWNITITDSSNPSISFNVPAGDNYSLVMTGTSGSSTGGTYTFYKNGSSVYSNSGGGGAAYSYTYSAGTLTASDVIKFSFSGSGTVASPITFKLIMQQNGSAISQANYSIVGESFTYNETTQKWTSTVEPNKQATIGFNVSVAGDYYINFTNPNGGPFYIYKNRTVVSTASGTQKAKLFNLQTTDKIIVDYSQYTSGSGVVEFYITEAENVGLGCDNAGTDTQITLSGTNTFPFSGTNLYKSLAYNGYMWGEVYEWTNAATTSGAYYGTEFTWDGTNYTLTSAKVGYDGTHHYTCNLTTAEGTCSSIRYYYYVSGTNNNYYITLTGGDSIEKAIEKMQANINHSNAKTQIDTWYAANMNTVTSKLEDTIWCNDRSISSKAGWYPTGNVTEKYLYYSPYDRAYNTNVPSLSCANKNDAFTVSNGDGNQKLTYPVALLTSDEMILAGGKGESSSTFYLASGQYYWSLSPYRFYYYGASGFVVSKFGTLSNNDVSGSVGLRPAVSLKPGTPVIRGTGTVTDPYVID